MEKRKVTVTVGGRTVSFYSDDPEEYIAALEKKADEALKRTAVFSGASDAVLAVLYLADQLTRAETEALSREAGRQPEAGTLSRGTGTDRPREAEQGRKAPAKTGKPGREKKKEEQVSIWNLLGGEDRR